MRRLLPHSLIIALVLASCGGGGGTATTTSPSATSSPPQGTTSPNPGQTSSSPPGATTQPQTCAPVTGGTETLAILKDVRIGTHDTYDRITFEFVSPGGSPPVSIPAGALPRYELTRVDRVIADGSGEPVDIAGSDLHLIVFHGASGFDQTLTPPVQVYKGPKEFKRSNFPILTELEESGDFEATLSWGFGLKQPRCPKVIELKNPTRLVLDIQH